MCVAPSPCPQRKRSHALPQVAGSSSSSSSGGGGSGSGSRSRKPTAQRVCPCSLTGCAREVSDAHWRRHAGTWPLHVGGGPAGTHPAAVPANACQQLPAVLACCRGQEGRSTRVPYQGLPCQPHAAGRLPFVSGGSCCLAAAALGCACCLACVAWRRRPAGMAAPARSRCSQQLHGQGSMQVQCAFCASPAELCPTGLAGAANNTSSLPPLLRRLTTISASASAAHTSGPPPSWCAGPAGPRTLQPCWPSLAYLHAALQRA